jgi:hypothetical protein
VERHRADIPALGLRRREAIFGRFGGEKRFAERLENRRSER